MLPSWLTQDYIQKALRAFYKDDQLRVVKVSDQPATGKGENFICLMTRIFVDFELGDGTVQKRSYIMKQAVPPEAPQSRIFAEYDVYNKEMDMYEIILPKMAQILREAHYTEKLAAEAIIVDRERSVMILEDLAPLSYRNADRVKQLDINHTQLTLDMLAKFHAAAIVLSEREPNLLKSMNATHFFSRGKIGYTEFFKGMFRAFLRFVNTQPKLQSRYGAKLEHVFANLMDYLGRPLDVGEKDLQTLIHGDCWTTNVMYQYDDEGKPAKALPIDFQFSTWTSPAVDLHYFFGTSLKTEVARRETELVQYHYYSLKRTLESLSFKGYFPSLLEYQLQFERRRFISVVSSTICQPFMVYVGTEEPEFESLYQDTPQAIRLQDALFDNIKWKIEEILPILDAKGVLDKH